MKIKPKKIFNTIIFVLFTLYISFYIASVSGYYEYEKKEETNLDSDTVTTIIHDYIDKHYSTNIKISQFADKYFFSKEYLTRQFKARYHCGIYEYVLQVRMERARDLLLNPDIKIQDVAQRVGYADNNYFSKAFRTYYGISPTTFRQEQHI